MGQMKIKILSRKDNPLLWREEIEGKVIYEEGTPKKEELVSFLAKELGVDKELVSVKTRQKFGVKEIDISVMVYASKEKMEKVEGRKRVSKGEAKRS